MLADALSVQSAPPSGTPKESFTSAMSSLERSIKKRITDHAAQVTDELHRRRTRPPSPFHPTADSGSRPPTPGAWSAASASQMGPTQQAGPSTRDDTHEDDHPAPLRGGGSADLPPAEQPDPIVKPPPRFPTPWLSGNAFSDRQSRDQAGPPAPLRHPYSPTTTHPSSGNPSQSHPMRETHFGGTTAGCSGGVQPGTPMDFADGGLPTVSTFMPVGFSNSMTPQSQVWHGGGNAPASITGITWLSAQSVSFLGIPPSMSYMVMSLHHKISSQWIQGGGDRFNGSGDRCRSGDSSTGSRSSSTSHNDAVRYSGWTEIALENGGISPERWIEFYTFLQLTATHYRIGIMPFEALNLQYASRGHGLCVPGLGLDVYTQTGATLFLILQKVLPMSDAVVASKVQSVALSGGNGFELLWVLSKHFVPMLTTMRQLTWPVWPSTDDVFLFARRVSLYCTLSRLCGQTPFTDAQRSELFLRNVGGVYREYAQHLLTTLSICIASHPDGSLPAHMKFSIPELAEALVERHQDDAGAQTPSAFFSLPAAHRADLPLSTLASSPQSITSGGHIQGFCVNVARVGKSVPRGPPSPPTTSSRRNMTSTRRAPFEGNCDACGKWGHKATTCDALAMGVYVQRYMGNDKNKAAIDEAMDSWSYKHWKYVATDSSPTEVLSRYCQAVQLPVEQVDDELDWDMLYCGPPGSQSEQALDPSSGPDPLHCNRTLVPTDSSVDWFYTSSSASSASGWYPQSFKVGFNPLVPPSSLLDSTVSHYSDFEGEVDVSLDDGGDEVSVTSSTVSLDFEPDAGIQTPLALAGSSVAAALSAFHRLPPPLVDVGSCILLSDPIVPPGPVICHRLDGFAVSTLADSGSNVCITNDLSVLVDVQDMAPRPLDVALNTGVQATPENMCTKFGYMPIQLMDGTIHRQRFLYNAAAAETITSPEDICSLSGPLVTWVQCGGRGPDSPGCLLFFGVDDTTVLLSISLTKRNGLYYSSRPELTRCSITGSSLVLCVISWPVRYPM